MNSWPDGCKNKDLDCANEKKNRVARTSLVVQ